MFAKLDHILCQFDITSVAQAFHLILQSANLAVEGLPREGFLRGTGDGCHNAWVFFLLRNDWDAVLAALTWPAFVQILLKSDRLSRFVL
jgi:hypothetical protein